jgi:hypothetical protein
MLKETIARHKANAIIVQECMASAAVSRVDRRLARSQAQLSLL